jgi:hypothetical protein
MTRRRIPTPAQVRAVPVTSVREMRAGLESVGLRVRPGGSHLRVTTRSGRCVGTLPATPSDSRSLLNTRAQIARRVAQIATRAPRRKS